MKSVKTSRWWVLGAIVCMFGCAPPNEGLPEPEDEPDTPRPDSGGGSEGWHPQAMRVDQMHLRGTVEIEEGIVDSSGVERRATSGEFVITYVGRMETRNDGVIETTCNERKVWRGELLPRELGQVLGCAACDALSQITSTTVQDITDQQTVPTDCPPRVLGGPGGQGMDALLRSIDGGALLRSPWMPLGPALDADMAITNDFTLADAVDWLATADPALEPVRIGLVDMTVPPLDPSGFNLADRAVPVEEGSDYAVYTLLSRERDDEGSADDEELIGHYVLHPLQQWAE